MMHFEPELKDLALELIKTKDNIDLFTDISELSKTITTLENCPTLQNLLYAQKLDGIMQAKYPIIGDLLSAGKKLANVFNMPRHQYSTEAEYLIEYLKQDIYGILCYALIKEKVIEKVDQFIDCAN